MIQCKCRRPLLHNDFNEPYIIVTPFAQTLKKFVNKIKFYADEITSLKG